MGRRSRGSHRGGNYEALANLVFIAMIGWILWTLIKRGYDKTINFLEQVSIFEWLCVVLIVMGVVGILGIFHRKIKTKRKIESERKMQEWSLLQEEIKKRRQEQEEFQRKQNIRHISSLNQLKSLDPFEFEKYIADIFRMKGYIADVTRRSGDGGKDIILSKDNVRSIVECKRYNATKVGRPDIQKFHSAIIDSNAQNGFYITTGAFTSPAIEYAEDKSIKLIGGNELMKWIDEVS